MLKESASDYDIVPGKQKQKFFALVGDKFLFAIINKTAGELILERSNSNISNMGLQNYAGESISTSDIKIGTNYPNSQELEELKILCENFLGFCRLKSFKGQSMTFDELTFKVNEFLQFNGYKAFIEYNRNQPSRKEVVPEVKKRFKKHKDRLKLEKKEGK